MSPTNISSNFLIIFSFLSCFDPFPIHHHLHLVNLTQSSIFPISVPYFFLSILILTIPIIPLLISIFFFIIIKLTKPHITKPKMILDFEPKLDYYSFRFFFILMSLNFLIILRPTCFPNFFIIIKTSLT